MPAIITSSLKELVPVATPRPSKWPIVLGPTLQGSRRFPIAGTLRGAEPRVAAFFFRFAEAEPWAKAIEHKAKGTVPTDSSRKEFLRRVFFRAREAKERERLQLMQSIQRD